MEKENKKKTVKTVKSVKKDNYYYALGRNKTSVATVRLYSGKGDTLINGKMFEEYYTDLFSKYTILKPFTLTGTQDTFYFTVKSKGGGINSQIKAISLAISRALSKINPEYKTTLSKNEMLKRDPRMVERKKYYRVKARKSPQFSKR